MPQDIQPVAPVITYKHLVAGSTIIMPKGKVCSFMGKPGGVGYYTTSDADEIAYIDAACKSPIVQMERVAAQDDGKISKPADPSIAQAAEDAAKNTALEANPEVAALRDKLSNVIATNKGK